MDLLYRKAGIRDLDMLTETRIQVLRAANHLDETVDMSKVRQESYDYYAQALRDGTHTAYLVFDGDRFAGAGGVSFYRVMPTCHNPTGWKAYIMNMYTHPEAGDRVSYAGSVSEGGQAGRYPIHYAGSHQYGQAVV